MVFRFSGSQIWYQFWGMKEEIGIQSPNILRKLSKGVSPGLFRWVFIVDWLLLFLFVCFFTETPGTVSGLLTLHPDLSSLFWERQRRDFPLQDGHQEAAAFLPRPTILLPINKPTLALSKILLFTVLLSEEKKERREEGKKEEKSCLSQFLDHQVHLRLSVRSADLEGHATQGKGRDQNKIGFLLRKRKGVECYPPQALTWEKEGTVMTLTTLMQGRRAWGDSTLKTKQKLAIISQAANALRYIMVIIKGPNGYDSHRISTPCQGQDWGGACMPMSR